jgi:hypothetical protein
MLSCFRTAAANMNALRGAAGTLFSRIKDTTKTVVATVQQTMTTKELGTGTVLLPAQIRFRIQL